MFDLFELFAPHRPEKGVIELRLAYVLEDHAIVVLGKSGHGILTVSLDKLEGAEIQNIGSLLRDFATKQKAEAEEHQKQREEYQAEVAAKAAKPTGGDGPGPGP